MQGSAAPRLFAQDLACWRGDRLLFRRLSLELNAGQALHVTGANGVGKTTLIRTLAGLTAPFSGALETHGAIGLLDERAGLDPDANLGAAIDFWNRIDGARGDGCETLAALGLDRLLDIPVRYLSTGQRKRAAMAVLINRAAPIWLLDEPLSGLDANGIALVTAQILNHLENGGLALIASHQQVEIASLRMLALEDYAPKAQEL